MKHYLDKFITGAIDWIWRKRSKGLAIIRASVPLLVILLGASWKFRVFVPTDSGGFRFAFDMDQGSPVYIIVTGLIVAVVLIIIGSALVIREEITAGKKRAIVIELRGLRDTSGEPLKEKVPRSIVGRREQVLVNIRRSDGQILTPEDALQQVAHLPTTIAQLETGFDRSDISFVAGGLAPVPFSFLVGLQLDDEGGITLMDWDRIRDCWRPLNSEDDGDRFSVSGIDHIGQAEEVVLSVSVSYPTDAQGISQSFPSQPVISMALSKLSTDSHWSEIKQAALAQEFFDTLRLLCGKNVKRVNLILAAPNSIVLRFGRIYDKRNLPPITVWQYERDQTPPYPWGVSMPVAGSRERIVRK